MPHISRAAIIVPALAGIAACGLVAMRPIEAYAQASDKGALELVDPNVFRACGDPRNLPFSNDKGEGFENKIAEIIADELKIGVRYYWLSQGPGFVRNTLGLKLCDVIIGYAIGTELVQHTNPYYKSVYTILVKRDGELSGIEELDDPRLKSKRIGVIAATPPVDHLAAGHHRHARCLSARG